ncbi:MAG: hypothetical protein H7Z72_15690 [Bacteroidetes bacterium]|nr:hypothetical protein [Fibrella sp.]
MLLTVCTIAQLPDALTLGSSFRQHHPDESFIIGLADDATRLPAGFQCPYPLLTALESMPGDLGVLSARYTPTEFTAAGKPSFIRAAFARFPNEPYLLYADPETFVYRPLTSVYARLDSATALLTPHITRPPSDANWPDEKAMQNVGLYSAGFLAFRSGAETDRLLAWWEDRVTGRAFIDACEGLCTDQLWLMHWPAFFDGIQIVKDPGWQVALWNLPERRLTLSAERRDGTTADWLVNGSTPLVFANFRGLTNPDAGFFPHQTRFRTGDRADVLKLLANYQRSLHLHEQPTLRAMTPTFGNKPEPVVLRGWRQTMATAARQLTTFIDKVPLPVFR